MVRLVTSHWEDPATLGSELSCPLTAAPDVTLQLSPVESWADSVPVSGAP